MKRPFVIHTKHGIVADGWHTDGVEPFRPASLVYLIGLDKYLRVILVTEVVDPWYLRVDAYTLKPDLFRSGLYTHGPVIATAVTPRPDAKKYL